MASSDDGGRASVPAAAADHTTTSPTRRPIVSEVILRFGDCSLDIDAHELRRDGSPVPTEPQVFDVLAYLVVHRARVVPKTELLDEVWGDRFVSESALSSRIKSARRAVGDTGRDQRIIRTIHGRGFRFVGEIVADDVTPPGLPRSTVLPDAAFVSTIGERLLAGEGLAVELVGEPPSRLGRVAEELYEASLALGHLVGRGSGAGAGLRPFGCIIDAVDELVQRAPHLLEGLPVSCRVELELVLGGHQPSMRPRLFLGVRELLVAAARDRPTLLVLEEVRFADPDTLDLLDHVLRLTTRRPLAVVVAHAPGLDLGDRCVRVELPPSGEDDHEDVRRNALPAAVRDALRTVALEGSTFDVALFEAAVGSNTASAHRLLDLAVLAGAVEPLRAGRGYRFVWSGFADDLAAAVPPHRREALHAELADRLRARGADAGRVAHHFLAAHQPDAALPYALEAARDAFAARRPLEVLRWTDAVLDQATGEERVELLMLRADALASTGDPTAVQVYREALSSAPPERTHALRAGLARAALLTGDLDSAREALAGVADDDRSPNVLLVRAMLAYFEGDLDRADLLLDEARPASLESAAPGRLLDVISLQGLIAHNRGEWFDRMRRELRVTQGSPDLAVTIFDSHLCVAEYMLYGPTPYQEVIDLSDGLRQNAEQSGARRAVAFAACVAGEARLLSGDLDRARQDLEESVALHRELSADAGTAHSLQRLAELELASGDPAAATRLLREAVVLARWSPISQHLLQRIYGTLIAAAQDGPAALAMVQEAAAVLDAPNSCEFCQVMIEVPATIAYASAGRLEDAHEHLARARLSSMFWEGTAWQGAVAEAEAAIASAEGRAPDAAERLAVAAALFEQAGQPLDAARCRDAREDSSDDVELRT